MTDVITYWSPGLMDVFGELDFATPMELAGRWQATNELFTDINNREQISNAIVYLNMEVEVGGWLFLGFDPSNDPKEVAGAYEVKKVDATHRLKSSDMLYKVYL